MKHRHLCGVWLIGLALAAQAFAAQGVQESTDPAKAAAAEKTASTLKRLPPQLPVGLVRGRTEAGEDILSGGITQADREAMQAERARFGLWISTVAKPSGAYLADVKIRITRLKPKSVVLERRMEGPWLLVALPKGHYEVTGRFREPGTDKVQTLASQVSIPAQGHREAVLRFDSKAIVDPDAHHPRP